MCVRKRAHNNIIDQKKSLAGGSASIIGDVRVSTEPEQLFSHWSSQLKQLTTEQFEMRRVLQERKCLCTALSTDDVCKVQSFLSQ